MLLKDGPVEATIYPFKIKMLLLQGLVEAVLPLQLQQEDVTERWPGRSYCPYKIKILLLQGPVEAVLPLQLQQENVTERWPCRSCPHKRKMLRVQAVLPLQLKQENVTGGGPRRKDAPKSAVIILLGHKTAGIPFSMVSPIASSPTHSTPNILTS